MLETGPHVPCVYVANDATSVGDMFRLRCERSTSNPAIYEKRGGRWAKTTWSQFYDHAAKVAHGLLELGLDQGDRVAVLGPTQAKWAFYDMGAQLAGMTSFGIYPKQAVEGLEYLLDHSDAKVIFVCEETELKNVLEAAKAGDKLQAIVPWSAELYATYKDADPRVKDPALFETTRLDDGKRDAILGGIAPDDTALFVYTSGTTGPPKAAMISHGNVLALLGRQDNFMLLFEDDISFNFLPMAHSAERILGFYGRICSGIATAYATSFSTVLPELPEVQPTLFGSVPRMFEKAYGKMTSEVEKKSPAVQKIFAWALKVAREAAPHVAAGTSMPFGLRLQHAIADRMVYRKVRDAFGGRVRHFVVGAAPIARDILEFFWGAGLKVHDVYGMTEATVLTNANRPGEVKLGTVGRVLPPLEQKIAEDGEILIKGPWVFKGYFKNPEATSTTVVDGWLHTGDIGVIDSDGYLKITDRKKHLIITAGGKNLSPANIENAIKNQSPLISQVHAHGDKRPYVSAIVAPSPIETLEFGVKEGVVTTAEVEHYTKELMANPYARPADLNALMGKVTALESFNKEMRRAVSAGNGHLAQVERVRRFVVLDRDFSQEEGELTPTMKVKRKNLEDKFSATFAKIYDDPEFALEP